MRPALVVPADAAAHVVDLDPSASATLGRWIDGEFAPVYLSDRLTMWVKAEELDPEFDKLNVQASITFVGFGGNSPVWADVVYTGAGVDPAGLDDDWREALLETQQMAEAVLRTGAVLGAVVVERPDDEDGV